MTCLEQEGNNELTASEMLSYAIRRQGLSQTIVTPVQKYISFDQKLYNFQNILQFSYNGHTQRTSLNISNVSLFWEGRLDLLTLCSMNNVYKPSRTIYNCVPHVLLERERVIVTCDVNCYVVIRKILDSTFNILPLFIHWRDIRKFLL
jgi:hypothetical protein